MLTHDTGESRVRGGYAEVRYTELAQPLEGHGFLRTAEETSETDKEGDLVGREEWGGASSFCSLFLSFTGEVFSQPAIDLRLGCTTCGDTGKGNRIEPFRTLDFLQALNVFEDVYSRSLPVQTVVRHRASVQPRGEYRSIGGWQRGAVFPTTSRNTFRNI